VNINQLLLVLVWTGSLSTSVLHGIFLPFWKTDLGWYYFLWPVTITLAFTPNMARSVFGDFSARQTLNTVMFALVVLMVFYGLVLLLKYLWQTRNEGRRSG
jgi:hypothetical protein